MEGHDAHIFYDATGGVVDPRKKSKFLPIGSLYRVDSENDLQKVHARRHRRPRRRQHRHVADDGTETHKCAFDLVIRGVGMAQGSKFRLTGPKFCVEFKSALTLELAPRNRG